MGTEPAQDETTDPSSRAFVVIRHGQRTWVTDLSCGKPVSLGRGPEASIRVYTPELAPIHARLRWDGRHVLLTDDAGPTFVNGKAIAEDCELRAGDEVGMGPCQMVVGIANAPTCSGRRALTHQEFRERLWEELARAGRSGRPTSLAMIQARPGEGRSMTRRILSRFRTGDLVGSYAQDEVEVLLPDTTGQLAQIVIARVLEDSEIDAIFGLAVAPQDAENHERLLRASRAALESAHEQHTSFATVPARQKTKRSVPPTTRDAATRALLSRIETIAPADAACLFVGELSSGKGVFGRMLHDRSPRASGPFVSIACSVMHSDTAADAAFHRQHGLAQRARGGSLFLDEVGDLSRHAQEQLCALLAHFPEIRPISGTQRALAGLVERGAFDATLYACLSASILEVPPLRNRPEDILPLAEKFALDAGGVAPVRMSPGAIARLRSYPWPGNVLELQNAMGRAVRLAGTSEILAEHLPSQTLPAPASENGLREHVDGVERDAIVRALADSNHNQTHAAKRLGVSRRALIYKMEKYGLKRPPRGTRHTSN